MEVLQGVETVFQRVFSGLSVASSFRNTEKTGPGGTEIPTVSRSILFTQGFRAAVREDLRPDGLPGFTLEKFGSDAFSGVLQFPGNIRIQVETAYFLYFVNSCGELAVAAAEGFVPREIVAYPFGAGHVSRAVEGA